MEKISLFFTVIFLISLFSTADSAVCQPSQDITEGIRYTKIFEKKLEGEGPFSVRAFDLKRNGGKNGIAVCGRKLYIFSPKGTLLTQSLSDEFTNGTKQVRIGKFSKNGFYNSIIATDGENSVKIFDSFGIKLSTIPLSLYEYAFFNKDLDEEGTDELILNGRAYYTKDEGQSWETLWENSEIRYMQDIVDSENEGGFCYNEYCGSIFSVDKNGKVLFHLKPGEYIRCLTAGDFDGNGKKDDVAVPTWDGTIYIYDKFGYNIKTIIMNIDGEIINLDEVMTIAAGKLNLNGSKDEVIVGGRRGLVACDTYGNILWSYIKWAGWNSSHCIYDLFITDLNNDGNTEVIAGKGDKILILSNKGGLLDELTLDGILSRWKYPNSTMDIADINNDGSKEIIAVTDKGMLYVFSLEKEE